MSNLIFDIILLHAYNSAKAHIRLVCYSRTMTYRWEDEIRNGSTIFTTKQAIN